MVDDFDWVTALGSCSLGKVFEQLKSQIEQDVDKRNKLREMPSFYKFEVSKDANSITILLEGNNVKSKSVKFVKAENVIDVQDEQGAATCHSATVTISNDRECRLRIDGKEYEFWQFRRMALEN